MNMLTKKDSNKININNFEYLFNYFCMNVNERVRVREFEAFIFYTCISSLI